MNDLLLNSINNVKLMLLVAVIIAFTPNYSFASEWVRGNEYGLEYQLEEIHGEKFVEKTYIRWNSTFDKNVFKKGKNLVDFSFQGGLIGGHYKGGKYYRDDFGENEKARAGITTEATTYYTYNPDGLVSPVASLGAEAEILSNMRLEWQGDVGAGVNLKVKDDINVRLMYEDTFFRKVDYLDDDRSYDQDDAYSISVAAEKKLSDGKTRAIRIRYENFKETDFITHDDGFKAKEPHTQHWLVAYKHTF